MYFCFIRSWTLSMWSFTLIGSPTSVGFLANRNMSWLILRILWRLDGKNHRDFVRSRFVIYDDWNDDRKDWIVTSSFCSLTDTKKRDDGKTDGKSWDGNSVLLPFNPLVSTVVFAVTLVFLREFFHFLSFKNSLFHLKKTDCFLR